MTAPPFRGLAAGLIIANFALVVFSLLGSAMLRLGLPAPEMDYWRLASLTAQASILIGATASFLIMVGGQGARSTLILLGLSAVIGGGSEWLGIATGFPYGQYSYTSMLGPTLGGLPLLIVVAWFMATGTAIHLARRLALNPWAVTLLAAALVTLWDLVLDPAMTTTVFPAWQWHAAGPYYGIPLTNFVAWFAVSALVAGAFTALGGDWRPDRSNLALWLYIAQGLLPAGLALLHGRGLATALWAVGLLGLFLGLYWQRTGFGGKRA
jgi:putative membrane protein